MSASKIDKYILSIPALKNASQKLVGKELTEKDFCYIIILGFTFSGQLETLFANNILENKDILHEEKLIEHLDKEDE